MNKKQERFALEYIKDLDATRAYKVAYGATKSNNVARASASRLLANVKVSTFIQEKLAEIERENIATAQEVEEYLTAVMRGEETDKEFKFLKVGVQVLTDVPVKTQQRLKAAEVLLKRHELMSNGQLEKLDAILDKIGV